MYIINLLWSLPGIKNEKKNRSCWLCIQIDTIVTCIAQSLEFYKLKATKSFSTVRCT